MRDWLVMLTSEDPLDLPPSWSLPSVVVALTRVTCVRIWKRTQVMQPSKTLLLKAQILVLKWTRLERHHYISPHDMLELMLLKSCWMPRQTPMLKTTQAGLPFMQLWPPMLKESSRFFSATEPPTSTQRLATAPPPSYWRLGWPLRAWLKI